MFQVQSLAVLLGLTLCVLPLRKIMAQQFSESDVVYEAARNKIGLIRYCRKKGMLDPAVADQVVDTVESSLHKVLPTGAIAGQRGDLAERAGEDGFWEAGRKRDIDSVAKLFNTTPADLCQEWAEETLRAQPLKSYREVTTITIPTPYEPLLPKAKQPSETPVLSADPILPGEPILSLGPILSLDPIPEDEQPVAPSSVAEAYPSAPIPPFPEKAPFVPTLAEPAALRSTLPAEGHLASTDRGLSEHRSHTTAAAPNATPPSWGQTVPLSAPIATEEEGEDEPLPRDRAALEEMPSRYPSDRSPSFWERWPFNKQGRSERCLMPGCRWPTNPQEKRSSGY